MEDNKFSLINIDGASDVVIKFLDMIEHAVGWCVQPKGKRKDFEEGLEIYKKEIVNDVGFSPIEKAALYADARSAVKQYINQGKIIGEALPYIKHKSHSDIDEDWLLLFFDYAKNISDNQVQNIWGKILAEKYNGNNSINRKLINCLYMMDTKAAINFEKLCKATSIVDMHENDVKYNEAHSEYIPIILHEREYYYLMHFMNSTKYFETKIETSVLQYLEELGLITVSTDDTYYCFENLRKFFVNINGCIYKAYWPRYLPEDNILKLTRVKYTTIGMNLCKILSLQQHLCLYDVIHYLCKEQKWIIKSVN